jgi:predicted RNA-binding Zn-ribbon protein involved in translation (DUF1610 family)
MYKRELIPRSKTYCRKTITLESTRKETWARFPEITCPYCGENHIWVRTDNYLYNNTLYLCILCGHSFCLVLVDVYDDDGARQNELKETFQQLRLRPSGSKKKGNLSDGNNKRQIISSQDRK